MQVDMHRNKINSSKFSRTVNVAMVAMVQVLQRLQCLDYNVLCGDSVLTTFFPLKRKTTVYFLLHSWTILCFGFPWSLAIIHQNVSSTRPGTSFRCCWRHRGEPSNQPEIQESSLCEGWINEGMERSKNKQRGYYKKREQQE